MSKFAVGDRVTVVSHGNRALAVTRVERMSKRKMVLASGSEWTIDGLCRWGCGDGYITDTVRAYRDGDIDEIRRTTRASS